MDVITVMTLASDVNQVKNNHQHIDSELPFVMFIAVECDDGEVRLLRAERRPRGQVEVCMNKRWLTVCYNGWNDAAALTVCRQLGYNYGKSMSLRIYTWALQCIIMALSTLYQSVGRLSM